MTQCPNCKELKRISITVGAPSTKRPIPVWRYACKKCGYGWIEDKNVKPEAD